jgi:hypothetical protein
MTAAETSSPRFTLLPHFGDGSPTPPRPPMPISIPFDAVVRGLSNSPIASQRRYNADAVVRASAFARYLTVLVSIKRP